MSKRKIRSFIWGDIFLVVFVLFSFALGSIFLQNFLSFSSNEGISGFDVAEVQSTCGTTETCSCGDTLVSSRILNSSDALADCTTNSYALQINTSHVALDCNSFFIRSANGSSTDALFLTPGVQNVTIRNCAFYNFTSVIASLTDSTGFASSEQASSYHDIIGSLHAFFFGRTIFPYFGIVLVLLFFAVVLFLWTSFHTSIIVPVVISPQKKTMKEYYTSFKALQLMFVSGNVEQKKQAMLSVEQTRKQCMQSWLESTTKIQYASSGAQITHGIELRLVSLPLSSPLLLSACTDSQSFGFLQAYFGTWDSLEVISSVLTFISGKTESHIIVILPPVDGRVQYPQRVAGLDFDKGFFRVSASGLST